MNVDQNPAGQNRQLLETFYSSFQRLDADGMNACYAPDVSFRDPVFMQLDGDHARGMWKMLASGSRGIDLTYEVGEVGEAEGRATWVAKYNFTATGRSVENHISSHFWFKDSLISRQEDTFDLWRWASMALGPKGMLTGWLPPVQAQIRAQATDRLDKFMAAEAKP
ncbi:MAG TPA: nuclear transport factor 2 family protein [Candidatus Dormibacteraeota bacterium]|nr:nuclear transport factor 2 family protein [Candidatus Dormibacteraeota bacterium]